MLLNNLSIIVRYSSILAARKFGEFSIGFPEHMVLVYLTRFGPANQDSIAKYYMIDKGSTAKTIEKLHEKEYIIKEQSPNNKRENMITLSDKGKELNTYMKTFLDEWNQLIFEGLTDEDIEQVNRITEIMAKNATKISNKEWSGFYDKT